MVGNLIPMYMKGELNCSLDFISFDLDWRLLKGTIVNLWLIGYKA